MSGAKGRSVTPRPASNTAWAESLTGTELALQLRKLVAGTYLLPTGQRNAVLSEAARRLSDETDAAVQS